MPATRITFVVKLWREQNAAPGEWRSEVRHVFTDEVCRFRDLVDLFHYMQVQMANMEDPGPEQADT